LSDEESCRQPEDIGEHQHAPNEPPTPCIPIPSAVIQDRARARVRE
jgi:hypothetical protein